jgi:hypothetical protein
MTSATSMLVLRRAATTWSGSSGRIGRPRASSTAEAAMNPQAMAARRSRGKWLPTSSTCMVVRVITPTTSRR